MNDNAVSQTESAVIVGKRLSGLAADAPSLARNALRPWPRLA
ncbi:hypothetical protein ACVWZ9_005650 [Pseudomonas chlororaphis]